MSPNVAEAGEEIVRGGDGAASRIARLLDPSLAAMSRRMLIEQLARAVREMAALQTVERSVGVWDATTEWMCRECCHAWAGGNEPSHREGCRVGRAQGLAALAEAQLRADESQLQKTVERMEAGDLTGFGEPWTVEVDGGMAVVRDARGLTVLDMTWSSLPEGLEVVTAFRIAECVNFCADVPVGRLVGVPMVRNARRVELAPITPAEAREIARKSSARAGLGVGLAVSR